MEAFYLREVLVRLNGRTDVLDLGCGMAEPIARFFIEAGCRVTGLESQAPMARLAMANVEANQLRDRVVILIGDLLRPPPRLSPASFDHVMANPPHLSEATATPPPDPGKAASNVEGEAKLGDWVKFCLTMAKPQGCVTLVHRADRLDQLLVDLRGQAGEITVFPLRAARGRRPASRAGAAAAPRRRAGRRLVLHETDGARAAAGCCATAALVG
jgi:tRNA1(Val) A37 N6-methylase TrmN6